MTTNPMLKGYPKLPPHVSQQILHIAGIEVTVFGLQELEQEAENVICVWLLHGRNHDRFSMDLVAHSALNAYYDDLKNSPQTKAPNLIAVSIDQRNHGSREANKLANQDWRSGNPTHAQDMFSIYHGTASDVSLLITYLPSYLFPNAEHVVSDNIVCGVSLGGHAAWLCLHDRRISSAVVVIGCPDYIALMSGRAEKSQLETAGPSFLGSKDFPEVLLEAVAKIDPAGMLVGIDSTRKERFSREPISDERADITPIMYSSFQNKSILNMAGGADKLVPYSCAEPFLKFLKRATAKGGFFEDGNLALEDIVFETAGHEFTPDMAQKLDAFIVEACKTSNRTLDGRSRL